MFTHEDARRRLVEYPGDLVCKALIAKAGCVVGDHYHKEKHERFVLLAGSATVSLGEWQGSAEAGSEFDVPPGTYHRFELSDGAILLGTASHEYNPSDEFRGRP